MRACKESKPKKKTSLCSNTRSRGRLIILSAYPYTCSHAHTFTCWSQRSPSCGATSLTMYSYMDSSSTANFFSIGSLSYLFVCVCVCVCVCVKRLRWYNIKQYSRKNTKQHLSISISISITRQAYTLTFTQPQTNDQTHTTTGTRPDT